MLDEALTEAEHLAKLKIAQRCQTDLYFLCKYILGYSLMTEAVHGDLAAVTQSLLGGEIGAVSEHKREDTKDGHTFGDQFDPKKNCLLLLMPRGTFKSSVVTIGFSLQWILSKPDDRILIDSETFSKSKAFLSEIKGHLESNEKFRDVYHTIHGSYPDSNKRDALWSDSQVNISARKRPRKEPTFSCAGIDVTKNGMHYDLIVMDDLHSEKNVTNKDQIEQVKDHYKLAFSLLDPGCPLIVIGTRWDYNDVYQHILDYEMKRFNVMVRKAILDDGSLLFPERLTKEFLDNTRESQGSYIFSCQYMNEPVDNETATFKRSYMKRVDWALVQDRPINWYMMVDPSFEGPYSDYVAAVLAGMDSNREIYVKEIFRQKMNYAGIIDLLFDWYATYNPKQIALETIAAQKSLQYMLNDEQKRRGAWLPVTEIKSRSKSKEERIRGLAPYYEFGHIYHVKQCSQLDELEYELLHFPKGKHDDIIDALATMLEIATPPNHNTMSEQSRGRKKYLQGLNKPRSPVTGI